VLQHAVGILIKFGEVRLESAPDYEMGVEIIPRLYLRLLYVLVLVCLGGVQANTIHLNLSDAPGACTPPMTFDLSKENFDSMSWSGVWELAQMKKSWEIQPAWQNQEHRSLSAQSYQVSNASNPTGDGRIRYFISELGSKHFHGGASFYATAFGNSLHVCAVQNSFDGHCPRPTPGNCSKITITLEWEKFAAYLNPTAGGGTINSNSGGFRTAKGVVLLNEEVCTPADAKQEPAIRDAGHWVTRASIEGESALGPFAEFQDKFVWKDSCGKLQRTSV